MNENDNAKNETELETEKEFSRPLGEVVKKAREKLKLTQGQVAEQTQIDQRTILNIENCRGNPKMESLYRLVRFYGIDPREFFYPEMQQDNPVREQLQLLVASCTEAEAAALIPILRDVLDALRNCSIELDDKVE